MKNTPNAVTSDGSDDRRQRSGQPEVGHDRVQRDDAELRRHIIVADRDAEQDVPAAEPQLREGEAGQRAEQHRRDGDRRRHEQRVHQRQRRCRWRIAVATFVHRSSPGSSGGGQTFISLDRPAGRDEHVVEGARANSSVDGAEHQVGRPARGVRRRGARRRRRGGSCARSLGVLRAARPRQLSSDQHDDQQEHHPRDRRRPAELPNCQPCWYMNSAERLVLVRRRRRWPGRRRTAAARRRAGSRRSSRRRP